MSLPQNEGLCFRFPSLTPCLFAPTPQAAEGEGCSFASDIWSVGATLFELVAGQAPYADIPHPQIVLLKIADDGAPPLPPDVSRKGIGWKEVEWINQSINWLTTLWLWFVSLSLSLPSPQVDVSIPVQDFMSQCFERDPKDRPSANYLLQHSWIRRARIRKIRAGARTAAAAVAAAASGRGSDSGSNSMGGRASSTPLARHFSGSAGNNPSMAAMESSM